MSNDQCPMLPLTKVFVLDFEGLGLECRWNANLPIYFACILSVDHMGRKNIHRHHTIETALEQVKELLAQGYLMVAHNAKFELAVMESRGLTLTIDKGKPSVACTMVMEYTRNSGLGSYSLDALTGLKTDVVLGAQEKGLLPAEVNKRDFWNTDWSGNPEVLAHIADYCVQDCKATWALYQRQLAWFNLPEHAKFRSSLFELEFPMLAVLSHMEVGGIHIDTEALQKLTDDCRKDVEAHRHTLEKVAKHLPKLQWDKENEEYVPFEKIYSKEVYKSVKNVSHYVDNQGAIVSSVSNLVGAHCPLLPYNSAAATGHTYWLIKHQCPEVLEKADKTPKGKPKLDKDFFNDVAEELPDNLPIAKFLKATKSLQMCVSVAEHIRGNRIHGSFNNCLTRTGRLSSSNPNLQNIQRSDKDPESVGSRFRQLFTAPEDKVILCADLS